ncbi:Imm26 family immunity protein [Listeria marthii]|uniref:Imm26 family immunity protein n=1 Tax=Listeria marthii TaxID=529731 RepID=UPI0018889B37|nr:Imm26 family immunity protein [Listeria marthii]MBF2517575.1 hypothetical protein [Listeria marthii]
MTKRKKQVWGVGDLFTISLLDGSFCIGRVVGFEPDALNSAICAFYAHRVNEIPEVEPILYENELISLLFVNRDLLDSGDWKVFSMASTEFPINKYIKLDELRRDGFINVTSRGSGIIVSLMNAYYSLVPWNSFHDPNYLDSLLISIDKKPNKVVLK